MTREEFDRLYFGKAVHCDTEEKANEFLALADSVGYKWLSGHSLIEKNYWEKCKKETCYHIRKEGVSFEKGSYYDLCGYYIIEYQPQPKFKAGDKVRVKSILYPHLNGKVGVIEVRFIRPIPYAVKLDCDDSPWFFYENELEKVEETKLKEETINNIIEEIKEYQEKITILLNHLEQEVKKQIMKKITLDELETLLKQSRAGIIPMILRDFKDNPKQFEKYLTMKYPVEEILADWA